MPTHLSRGRVASCGPWRGSEGNWIQTDPGKGWFVLLRLYSPLQPYFDKSWRPSEIEPHNPSSD